ncbi:extracellular tyrosine-protein kinase PKDCC-like [Saccoglossus kowalevskii]|uniref:Protein kinase domain-containing protein, cytoplasmic-like n=1 Tax=Saccoglossus kowalevskii TaxID=10224 RepID=A0ABM0GJJ9_SACKO|nr:PREDICTED: protein kinase domain-containing protein, cytoplasmic-like [Saccoglossus kowalevskii]
MARCNIGLPLRVLARHRRLITFLFMMVSWFMYAENYLVWPTNRSRFSMHSSLFSVTKNGDRHSPIMGFETRLTKHIRELETDLNNYRHQVSAYKNSVDQLHMDAMEPNIRRLMDIKQFKLTGEDTLSSTFHNGHDTDTHDGYLGCSHIFNASTKERLGMGYTKYVERAEYNGNEIAIKSVAMNGRDVNECVARYMSSADCLKLANYKLLKEITLFNALKHTNVLKVLGSCLGDVDNQVKVITELGKPVNIINLLQLSWEDRFRIALGIARLLHHLARSPMGSLAIHDFKLAQFVTVGGEIKLADIDDVDNEEPVCMTSEDCAKAATSATSKSVHLPCVNMRCQAFSEKINIYNSYRYFFSYLLPFDVPSTIKPIVDQILNNSANFNWTAAMLQRKMEECLLFYTSGEYLARNENADQTTVYRAIPGHDLPGKHDYPCLISHSGNGCTTSAFDVREAEEICTRDKECQAIVMTSRLTWSGRVVIYLKNNSTDPEPNPNTTLYVRVT